MTDDKKSVDVEIMRKDEDENLLPFYLTSESKLNEKGVTVSIFDLDLEDLIYEKMYILFEKYQVVELSLKEKYLVLQLAKDKMLLEVDFTSELNKTRPTIAEKDAWMRPYLAPIEEEIDKLNENSKFYKTKLNVINDLINAKRVLLKVEGNLL